MFAKHDPALSRIIPFGEDPYDAVGSFAVIIAMLAALLSLARSFWPYWSEAPSAAQQIYLVRAQTAVVLAVFIAVASDAVAMARHTTMWLAAPQRNELVALLGGIAVVAGGLELRIYRSVRQIASTKRPAEWARTAIVGLAAVLLLAVYPERLVEGTATHLFTVVIGSLILFVPMRPLLMALVPYETTDRSLPGIRTRYRWGIVLSGGVLVGALLFGAEMNEGGGSMPLERILFVASVFIGLATVGLAIAYATLAGPLGL